MRVSQVSGIISRAGTFSYLFNDAGFATRLTKKPY